MKVLTAIIALFFVVPITGMSQDVKTNLESENIKTAMFMVAGMESQKQAAKIDKQMAAVPGVRSIKTTFSVMKSEVEYDASKITEAELIQKISLHRVGVSDYSNWVDPSANRAAQYNDDGTLQNQPQPVPDNNLE